MAELAAPSGSASNAAPPSPVKPPTAPSRPTNRLPQTSRCGPLLKQSSGAQDDPSAAHHRSPVSGNVCPLSAFPFRSAREGERSTTNILFRRERRSGTKAPARCGLSIQWAERSR